MLVNLNGVETLYYGYADNQGSLIALTDASGNIVEKYAYDPWGARRNPNDWTQNDSRTTWITNRGYTGHEHLDMFNIINMNGRVYDPLTAQFFSPDPFIQSGSDWKNYNRYSYCMNNPTRNTDPSGYMKEPNDDRQPKLMPASCYYYGSQIYHPQTGGSVSAGYAYSASASWNSQCKGSISYDWGNGKYEYANGDEAATKDAMYQLYSGTRHQDMQSYSGSSLGYDHLYALDIGGSLRLAGSVGGSITGIGSDGFITSGANTYAYVLATSGSPVCFIPQSDPNSHTDALGYYHNYTENETKAATDFMLGVGLSLLGGEAVGPYIGKVGSFISNGGIKAVVQAAQYQAYKAIGYLGAGTVGAVGANLVGGGLEGYLKYKTYTPIDTEIPYLFDNPAWHVGSDLINNILTIENDK